MLKKHRETLKYGDLIAQQWDKGFLRVLRELLEDFSNKAVQSLRDLPEGISQDTLLNLSKQKLDEHVNKCLQEASERLEKEDLKFQANLSALKEFLECTLKEFLKSTSSTISSLESSTDQEESEDAEEEGAGEVRRSPVK